VSLAHEVRGGSALARTGRPVDRPAAGVDHPAARRAQGAGQGGRADPRRGGRLVRPGAGDAPAGRLLRARPDPQAPRRRAHLAAGRRRRAGPAVEPPGRAGQVEAPDRPHPAHHQRQHAPGRAAQAGRL
ncbi:MAG: hypothetical protein AVDCRST_MAG66-943, partial [uncultured Pseudonocardia sp.]